MRELSKVSQPISEYMNRFRTLFGGKTPGEVIAEIDIHRKALLNQCRRHHEHTKVIWVCVDNKHLDDTAMMLGFPMHVRFVNIGSMIAGYQYDEAVIDMDFETILSKALKAQAKDYIDCCIHTSLRPGGRMRYLQ